MFESGALMVSTADERRVPAKRPHCSDQGFGSLDAGCDNFISICICPTRAQVKYMAPGEIYDHVDVRNVPRADRFPGDPPVFAVGDTIVTL